MAGSWRPSTRSARGRSGDRPRSAIGYSTARLNNVVEEVNRRIQAGAVPLSFEGRGGFLRSALEALQIPVDSQLLPFRATAPGKANQRAEPRAIYFNDRVTLGWVRDGEFIEVAAHDESAGVAFYTLEQRAGPTYRAPQFMRGARVRMSCVG